ncbi:MAG: acyl-CoA dehydrogenase [Candidatus Lokiarchaeota archaeon]|nr:acyl-CoA dehydrogenase [Candidatus Lokiarchaeota archaeon]MBD3198559.1 acyl-CoA dehydrogenase [Candidatus Lokiarchaeota archaeon]
MCAQSQEGNRDNPYSFDDFLFVRDNFNYYQDDDFLKQLVQKFIPAERFQQVDRDLNALSDYVSYRFKELANMANELENRVKCTKLKHYDAHNHRIDRIERCKETEILEKEIFSLGLFDPNRNDAWSRFVKMFLLYQNSEAGVMCPIACTHGMIELLQKYEKELQPELVEILNHIRSGKNGEYAVGAQFVSEIQGGSDVPSNLVEAVFVEEEGEDGMSNTWRLYGQKFFCSATQADYAVVSAKPKGVPSSTRVASFLVPSWLPGNKHKEIRNSYTIDRLKPKMGTAELPTAEITYNGAVAYPIGPLEKGLADIVGIVLSISRLHVAFGMAAAALRIAREATIYAQFREAFGVPVSNFPLMINQINDLNLYAKRAAAGAFKVYSEYIYFNEELISGIRNLKEIDNLEERKRRFRLRELIMFQKIVVADDAPAMTRMAISFFGGHGVMEDFLSFPRFFRDSIIMELWEGPRNVLLTQIHRDFQRVSEWYPADDFIRDLLDGLDKDRVEELSYEFKKIIDHDTLLKADQETLKLCRDWQELSNKIFHAYQDLALKELNDQGKPLKFSKLLRKFRKREK